MIFATALGHLALNSFANVFAAAMRMVAVFGVADLGEHLLRGRLR